MDRLHDAKRLWVQARSLRLMARAVISTAREISACTREVRHESEALLKRIQLSRLHEPFRRITYNAAAHGTYSSPGPAHHA
jgi:hypothetical protein